MSVQLDIFDALRLIRHGIVSGTNPLPLIDQILEQEGAWRERLGPDRRVAPRGGPSEVQPAVRVRTEGLPPNSGDEPDRGAAPPNDNLSDKGSTHEDGRATETRQGPGHTDGELTPTPTQDTKTCRLAAEAVAPPRGIPGHDAGCPYAGPTPPRFPPLAERLGYWPAVAPTPICTCVREE